MIHLISNDFSLHQYWKQSKARVNRLHCKAFRPDPDAITTKRFDSNFLTCVIIMTLHSPNCQLLINIFSINASEAFIWYDTECCLSSHHFLGVQQNKSLQWHASLLMQCVKGGVHSVDHNSVSLLGIIIYKLLQWIKKCVPSQQVYL